VIEEARERLKLVSERQWDDPSKDPCEIRQWFNRRALSRQRRSAWLEASAEEFSSSSVRTAEVEGPVRDPLTVSPGQVDLLTPFDPWGLVYWDDAADPLFDHEEG
jgi:hypothetical protein